jgi:pimeloyl-ACP methyl ester carboxylesterase
VAATEPAHEPAAPAPVNGRTRVWRRRAWRIVRGALLVYLGVAIVLYALQNWMIFPGHSTQGQKLAVVPRGADYELLDLQTKSGERVVAVFGKALDENGNARPDASSRPTLVFFYGNGMCLADFMGELRKFRKLGANVLAPDYCGYGMSGGKPSEASFYATADACWQHLMSRGDIDKSRIVAAGWSIGAAVAIELASRERVAGVATFSAFTSMTDMGRALLPWLPTSLLLSHRFESERKLRDIDVPTLIVHGSGDQIIPFAMSQRLSKAAKGKVTTLWLETDHNDLFDLGGDEILSALKRFLDDLPTRG